MQVAMGGLRGSGLMHAWRSWMEMVDSRHRLRQTAHRMVLRKCVRAIRLWRAANKSKRQHLRNSVAAMSPAGQAQRRALNTWTGYVTQRAVMRRAVSALVLRSQRVSFNTWSETLRSTATARRQAAMWRVWQSELKDIEGQHARQLQDLYMVTRGLAEALDADWASTPAALLARICRPSGVPMTPIRPVPEIISLLRDRSLRQPTSRSPLLPPKPPSLTVPRIGRPAPARAADVTSPAPVVPVQPLEAVGGRWAFATPLHAPLSQQLTSHGFQMWHRT